MSGINQYLKEKLSAIDGSVLVAPNIPSKKLSNAINSFRFDGDADSIIGIYDSSLLSNAKAGILISGSTLICKPSMASPVAFSYVDIASFSHDIITEKDKKGNVKQTSIFKIELKNNPTKIYPFPDKNLSKLAEILNGALSNYEKFEDQNQLQPLETLPDTLKIAYLKVIVNMAFDNDGVVDEEEFSEILLLMTRLRLSPEARFILRQYMLIDVDHQESIADQIATINSSAPDGMQQSLHVSLVKDLISLNCTLNDEVSSDFAFLKKNLALFDVNEKEIALIEESITNDRKIFDRSYTDSALAKHFKDLSAQAAAIGVPLGAIYLSGSVMGFSAAGMTSGLAALGMGGILGISSMATGIGTVVVLGVVTYAGIKRLTNSTTEGDKQRESLIKDVIRQTQRTLNVVIDDINYLTEKLSSALAEDSITKEKIQQLSRMLSQYVRASKVIGKKVEKSEIEEMRLRSPEFLDIERLKALTKDFDKKKHFDLILNFYQKEVLRENKDDAIIEKTIYRLTHDADSMSLEQLGKLFDDLGYNTATGAIKGKFDSFLSRDT